MFNFGLLNPSVKSLYVEVGWIDGLAEALSLASFALVERLRYRDYVHKAESGQEHGALKDVLAADR